MASHGLSVEAQSPREVVLEIMPDRRPERTRTICPDCEGAGERWMILTGWEVCGGYYQPCEACSPYTGGWAGDDFLIQLGMAGMVGLTATASLLVLI